MRPKKALSLSVAVSEAPGRVSSKRILAPSVTSVRLSANNSGDNEVKMGTVHRSPSIYITAVETPENLS